MKPAELVFRIILALVLPPMGIIGLKDVGCGTLLLLTFLTLFFWIPGQVTAIILIVREFQEASD